MDWMESSTEPSIFASLAESRVCMSLLPSQCPMPAKSYHYSSDNIMANQIFIYEGGRAPQNIRHARIDESLSAIPDEAFMHCPLLLDIEIHKREYPPGGTFVLAK